jgi:hypothetical protein
MKVFIAVFPAACAAIPAPMTATAVEASAEQQGDLYVGASDAIVSPDDAVKNIDLAIRKYGDALGSQKVTGKLVEKYVSACYFKYRYFTAAADKKKDYETLIKRFEPLGKRLSGTKHHNYVIALLWGRSMMN